MIFIGSTDLLSSNQTSKWVTPIIRWFKPNISHQDLWRTMTIIRKGGHVTEYAILAILLWRAIPKTATPGSNSIWRWPDAAMAQGVCVFFAMSDEFHQSFIPSRTSAIRDVLFDIAGAALGLTVVWLICRPKIRSRLVNPPARPIVEVTTM